MAYKANYYRANAGELLKRVHIVVAAEALALVAKTGLDEGLVYEILRVVLLLVSIKAGRR